jgi:hypothetical protein
MRGEIDARDAEVAQTASRSRSWWASPSISPNFPMAPISTRTNPRLIYIHQADRGLIGKFGNFSKGSSPS